MEFLELRAVRDAQCILIVRWIVLSFGVDELFFR
jgi:hypothetical protein